MTQPAAIITGASSGIGRATAQRLAKRRYRLVLIARNRDKLDALAHQLAPTTICHVLPLDLADPHALHQHTPRLLADFAPIHVLVNNAGAGLYQPFLDTDSHTIRQLMQVHYFAPAALIRAVLPDMLKRNSGRIINIASIAAEVGPWGHSGYAAAKAALRTLTHCLAAEYSRRDLHFSCISPGVINTAFFDKPDYQAMAPTVRKRAIPADRVAEIIERMLDHPRLEVTVPRLYRAVAFLHAASPTLAHYLVTRNSRPPS